MKKFFTLLSMLLTFVVGSFAEGKTIYYRLADEHVKSIIGQGYEHITE